MSGSAAHTRLNTGVLAAAEKRVLLALARALPHRIHSDHLSTFALVSMLGAAAGFAAMRVAPWTGAAIVMVALVCNWFGDSLDGTVARVRGHERPRFGYYVDHVIDLSGTAALFIGLGVSGLMSPLMAAAVGAANPKPVGHGTSVEDEVRVIRAELRMTDDIIFEGLMVALQQRQGVDCHLPNSPMMRTQLRMPRR